MKKLISIVLVLLLSVSVAACADNGKEVESQKSVATEDFYNLTFKIPSEWEKKEFALGNVGYIDGSNDSFQTILIVNYDGDLPHINEKLNYTWIDWYLNGDVDTLYFDKEPVLKDYSIDKLPAEGKSSNNTVTINDSLYFVKMIYLKFDTEVYDFTIISQNDTYDADLDNIINTIVLNSSSSTETQAATVEDTITMGEKNALEKANSYLSHTPFSRKGLIKQLEYEGFTKAEANYGVDNCVANWKEQAVLKAESYISHSSFSRQGLIDQLEYEGFTHKQAVYGAESVGY